MSYDNKKEYSDTNSPRINLVVLWYGDLDGDGKLDFLLGNTEDIGESYGLYLSSAANNKGQYIYDSSNHCGC